MLYDSLNRVPSMKAKQRPWCKHYSLNNVPTYVFCAPWTLWFWFTWVDICPFNIISRTGFPFSLVTYLWRNTITEYYYYYSFICSTRTHYILYYIITIMIITIIIICYCVHNNYYMCYRTYMVIVTYTLWRHDTENSGCEMIIKDFYLFFIFFKHK